LTDMPVVVILPDYDVSTAQSLVSLLYTGSCNHKSSASYFSLLSMLSSLGINLSSSSLVLQSSSQNNVISRPNIMSSSSSCIKSFPCQNIGSEENEDITTGEDVKGNETMLCVEVADDDNIAVSEAETNQINQQLLETNSAKLVINLTTNLCPVCQVQVGGGKFLLRKHLVEKHFFKELSSMLEEGIKHCPVCEKTIVPRFSLVRHFGIGHRRVDQLIGVDSNQNNPTNIAINEAINEEEEKNVQDEHTEAGGSGRVMYGEQNEASDSLVRSKMMKNFSGGWQCTECDFAQSGKTALNNLYAHVESNHVHVSFICYICYKECKTRNSLLLHRSRNHKNM